MSELHHILVVDGDLMNCEIAMHLLGADSYRYSTAENGRDALRRVAQDKPSVILLDILMPDMDGLETCRHIRSDAANDDITILFVTSQDDAQTRLSAYAAGGDDILAKPLTHGVIRHKVETALKNHEVVTGLRQEIDATRGMLMTSLTTTGEYGVVMHTLRNSLPCRSLGELAEVTLRALDAYGLQGAVQLRAPDAILTLNSERRSSPIDQEMLRNLSLGNRHIYDYGNRSVFCYPNVALLVRNMPTDSADLYGRMKDNLALLAEGVEYRLDALTEELKMRAQRANLVTAAALLNHVLSQVDGQFKRSQAEMNAIFAELEQKLEWSLAGLGFSEDQERSLWSLIRPLADRPEKLYQNGEVVDQQLAGALATLRTNLNESGAPE